MSSKNFKMFKVAAASGNLNSFGLRGYVLVAQDGESWEVARSDFGSNPILKRGDGVLLERVEIDPPAPLVPVSYHFAEQSFELPRHLRNAPAKVLSEVWPVGVPFGV